MPKYVLAGEVGIEPTNAGIKIRCLTTWRLPNNFQSSTQSCNGCLANPCATKPRIGCGNCCNTASAWPRLSNSANTHAPDPVILALPKLLSHAICRATSGYNSHTTGCRSLRSGHSICPFKRARIVMETVSRVNSGCAKICAVGTCTGGNSTTYHACGKG